MSERALIQWLGIRVSHHCLIIAKGLETVAVISACGKGQAPAQKLASPYKFI